MVNLEISGEKFLRLGRESETLRKLPNFITTAPTAIRKPHENFQTGISKVARSRTMEKMLMINLIAAVPEQP